jgi:hypothetical protein
VAGTEPGELARARLVVGLYDRWGYHPGLLDADAELLRMLRMIELAGPEDGREVSGYGE